MTWHGLSVAAWWAGIALLTSAGVFSVLGLAGRPAPAVTMKEHGGVVEMNALSPTEAAGEATRAHRFLTFTRVGVLLATLGGLALALATQPWAP